MKIGVVGLGLIGGSIFKSLTNNYELVGVSSSVKAENISNNYEILRDCNLVFVCTPMNAVLKTLDKLEDILLPSTIVTDVSSLKEFVSKKTYSYKFIPSHPMAGTENSGWNNSFPELFKGAKWVITPLTDKLKKEQAILEDVIKHMGAETLISTPEAHDEAVALISHMPMIVAQALCINIKENKLAQQLASSGFRDTTRLALSNIEMATDMVELNLENINKSLSKLDSSISELLGANYTQLIAEIKEFRKNLY